MKKHFPSNALHPPNVLRAFLFAAIVATAFLGLLLAAPSGGFAATLYVSTTSATPQPPYGNWATAAQNIQAAVDAAQAGDTVLVNDGVYVSGGRAVDVMNRVAISRAITVKSVNGPGATVIDGANADRCVYLGDGALLSGFTLTRGHAADSGGGGVWCAAGAVVTNCALTDNSSFYGAGGASGGTLYNCTLSGNFGSHGGGAAASTLYNCTLTGNSADIDSGGGAYGCTLYNCALTDNSAIGGGGAYGGTLYNCTLTDNSAEAGGGAYGEATLYNCTLTGNDAGYGGGAEESTLYNCMLTSNHGLEGGGAENSTLYKCTLTGNHSNLDGGGIADAQVYNSIFIGNSASYGGAASGGTLYNCTVVGNTAASDGGGVLGCSVSNSIVYYNSAPQGPNYDGSINFYSTFDHSCTTPLPSGGIGNISQEPGFVDLAGGNYRLQIISPCINAGLNQDWMVGATDLDGNPRISWGTVDTGAYEFLLPASGPWKNHGQYVSTVAHVAAQFVARGLITQSQAGAFVSAAANSNIGNHKRE